MKRLGISYDQLFHTIPGYYLVLQANEPTCTVIDVSDSLACFFKRDRNEFANHSLKHFFTLFSRRVPTEVKAMFRAGVGKVIESREPCDLGVVGYSSLKKHPHLWRTMLYPIVDGHEIRGVIVAFDSASAAMADKARDEQIQRLEQLLEINTSKDEFISIASHQLRTPATAVKQYLGMLREGMFGELSSLQLEILTRAYDNNERQLAIVTDLLKVAQVDGGKVALRFEGIDMSRLVGCVVADATELFARRSQAIRYRPPIAPIVVSVDAEIVRMVLENLLDNASKYSPEKTNVTVTIRELKQSVKIAVKDQGVGISAKEQSKLFEKFSRIDNMFSTKVGGTGLGLYWAKRVIDLHGGRIGYKPNHPQGSVFEITLPITHKV